MAIEVLRETEPIVQHLEDLIQGQIRLQVSFTGDRGQYLTQPITFLSSTNKTLLLLDALTPEQGQIKAEINNRLTCEYKFDHQDCVFTAEIDHLVEEPRKGVVVRLPEEISPLQKRRHFRVEPSLDNPVHLVALHVEDYTGTPAMLAERCVVVDVSAGGISFNTDIPRASLEPGTILKDTILKLPELEPFKVDLVVRSIRNLRSGKYHHRIGAEFQLPDETARDIINRYVTNKQREDIRKYKRELD